jgi:lysozyme
VEPSIEIAAGIARPFEDLRLSAYHDPVGYPTQGYGRLLSRTPWEDLSRWPDIDEATAERWLEEDMSSSLASVRRLIVAPLTDEQEAALVDFAFNCGAGNLQVSTLRRVVNRGEYEAAPAQFMRWVYARGVRLNGLVRRRRAEVWVATWTG